MISQMRLTFFYKKTACALLFFSKKNKANLICFFSIATLQSLSSFWPSSVKFSPAGLGIYRYIPLIKPFIDDPQKDERERQPDDESQRIGKHAIRCERHGVQHFLFREQSQSNGQNHARGQESHHENPPKKVRPGIGDMDIEEIIAHRHHNEEESDEHNSLAVEERKSKPCGRKIADQRQCNIAVQNDIDQLRATEIQPETDTRPDENQPKRDISHKGGGQELIQPDRDRVTVGKTRHSFVFE